MLPLKYGRQGKQRRGVLAPFSVHLLLLPLEFRAPDYDMMQHISGVFSPQLTASVARCASLAFLKPIKLTTRIHTQSPSEISPPHTLFNSLTVLCMNIMNIRCFHPKPLTAHSLSQWQALYYFYICFSCEIH